MQLSQLSTLKYTVRFFGQKFRNFVQKKYKTCMSVQLNILCLICINLHYAEFDKNV